MTNEELIDKGYQWVDDGSLIEEVLMAIEYLISIGKIKDFSITLI